MARVEVGGLLWTAEGSDADRWSTMEFFPENGYRSHVEKQPGFFTAETIEELEDLTFMAGCLLTERKKRNGKMFATLEDIREELNYCVPDALVDVVWRELECLKFLGKEEEGRKMITAEPLYVEKEYRSKE